MDGLRVCVLLPPAKCISQKWYKCNVSVCLKHRQSRKDKTQQTFGILPENGLLVNVKRIFITGSIFLLTYQGSKPSWPSLQVLEFCLQWWLVMEASISRPIQRGPKSNFAAFCQILEKWNEEIIMVHSQNAAFGDYARPAGAPPPLTPPQLASLAQTLPQVAPLANQFLQHK